MLMEQLQSPSGEPIIFLDEMVPRKKPPPEARLDETKVEWAEATMELLRHLADGEPVDTVYCGRNIRKNIAAKVICASVYRPDLDDMQFARRFRLLRIDGPDEWRLGPDYRAHPLAGCIDENITIVPSEGMPALDGPAPECTDVYFFVPDALEDKSTRP